MNAPAAARRKAGGRSASGVGLFSHPKAREAKIAIRLHMLDAIGAASAHVFDAFAGIGEMRDGAWGRAASYVGCDAEWQRLEGVYIADNLKVMRSLDLARFNVFDFDAFGSPWDQVELLSARRRVVANERVGLCITDGSNMYMRLSGIPHSLARLISSPQTMPHAHVVHDSLIQAGIVAAADRMGARIERVWRAAGSGHHSAMRYYAAVMIGN